MKTFKHYNTLVKSDEGIYLCHASDIKTVVFGNDTSYSQLYELDRNNEMTAANENGEYEEDDFENLYEEYTDFNAECGDEKFEFEDVYGETKPYAKAEWNNYEQHSVLHVAHGINETTHNVTDAEIIHGECFRADNYIPQDYPRTEHQSFFKFASEFGEVYYIKRTFAFFSDQSEDTFEFVTDAEFSEYENEQ